jgi:hypothetical protein
MRLTDKVIQPFTPRYWRVVSFMEKFLPSDFTITPAERLREHTSMLMFIYGDARIAERYEKFDNELRADALADDVDSVFEDAE